MAKFWNLKNKSPRLSPSNKKAFPVRGRLFDYAHFLNTKKTAPIIKANPTR